MKDKVAVERYSEAYVAYALPKIGLDRIVKDMHDLRAVLRDIPDLTIFFEAPEVPLQAKVDLIEKTLGELLASETRDFIEYLISKKRISSIVEIAERIRVVYSHGEVQDVLMTTTFPLDVEVIERVKKAIAKRINKKVNLYLQMDTDLLGGAKVKIGNYVIDGSLRGQLENVRKYLMGVQVAK